MTSIRPSLSVIVPVYNGRRYLGEALASVFAQTMLPDEVIVVDDASTDGSAELVERLVESAPLPLRLIRLTTNSGGPAHPLNVGIGAARGDLIAVLDQDDVFTPTKLEDQARVLVDDPACAYVFSFCGVYGIEGDTRQSRALHEDLLAQSESRQTYHELSGDRALFLLIKHGSFVLGYPGFVFRRRDWSERNGLDESLRIASDYDLLCWLSTRGAVAYVPKIVYQRREHGNNLSGPLGPTSIEGSTVMLRYFVAQQAAILRAGSPNELREALLRAGYWLRRARCYREAMHAYTIAAGRTGLDSAVVRDFFKLLVQWIGDLGSARSAR